MHICFSFYFLSKIGEIIIVILLCKTAGRGGADKVLRLEIKRSYTIPTCSLELLDFNVIL